MSVLQSLPSSPDDQVTCGFPNDDPASIDSKTAQDKSTTFCNNKKDQTVVVGSAIDESTGFGNGMVLNITVTQNPTCSYDKTQTLAQDDCTHFLGQTIGGNCGKDPKKLFGGTVSDGCFTYVLHPQDNQGELQCQGQGTGTGVNLDEISADVKDFCKTNARKTASSGINLSRKYKMKLGDS